MAASPELIAEMVRDRFVTGSLASISLRCSLVASVIGRVDIQRRTDLELVPRNMWLCNTSAVRGLQVFSA